MALWPTAINFGSIAVGQTSPAVNVRLSNLGNKKLSISAIQISGNFVEANNCPKQLSIGKTCIIQVTFQPQSKGTQTGAVKISDSALGASQQISLTGLGK